MLTLRRHDSSSEHPREAHGIVTYINVLLNLSHPLWEYLAHFQRNLPYTITAEVMLRVNKKIWLLPSPHQTSQVVKTVSQGLSDLPHHLPPLRPGNLAQEHHLWTYAFTPTDSLLSDVHTQYLSPCLPRLVSLLHSLSVIFN